MIFPIVTQRLSITKFEEGMAEQLHLNSIDDDNRRFVPDEVFEMVEVAQEKITQFRQWYTQENTPLVYPILLHNGQQIGYVQAVPYKNGWELGYHIAKNFTGHGYATEAVGAFLPLIMQKLGISEIQGICLAENIASRRVLEKCGFVLAFEGRGKYQGKKRPICCFVYLEGARSN